MKFKQELWNSKHGFWNSKFSVPLQENSNFFYFQLEKSSIFIYFHNELRLKMIWFFNGYWSVTTLLKNAEKNPKINILYLSGERSILIP